MRVTVTTVQETINIQYERNMQTEDASMHMNSE